MLNKLLYIIISLLILNFSPIIAQEENEDLLEQLRKLSLKEILNVEVSITSLTPLSMREAPGIVTLITKEDILNSGSRDLLDVLTLLVPGFNFMQSEFGPLGVGVRGLWAYEGKVLLLIDGIECNEEGFSSVIFGNHYLLENIERIEIIRGPGSVVYGGNAGLAVISITTKKAELNGAYAGLQFSRMYDNFSHRNLSFGAGRKWDEFGLSLTGYVGEGRLSDRKYIPYFSNQQLYNLETSKIKFNPLLLNLNASYKGVTLGTIFEKHYLYFAFPIEFTSFIANLKYDYKASENLVITPNVELKIQKPWLIKARTLINNNGIISDTLFSNNKTIDKKKASISINWEMIRDLHLLAGVEGISSELTTTFTEGYIEFQSPGGYEIKFDNFISYAQFLYETDIFNLTVGGRFEKSNVFGSYFIPRVALTKLFNKFHMKAMVSQAYRNPGGRYFDRTLVPEKGINYEVEAGYQFTDNNFLVVNLYDIRYKDIITIEQDTAGNFFYDNVDKISTRGVELEYKFIIPKFSFGFNFSYYHITENTIQLSKADPNSNDVLGFPSLRMNAFAGIKVSEKLSINPSISFFGSRYGYIKGEILQYDPFITQDILKQFDPVFLININFRTKDLFVDGIQVDLGIKNLLNNDFEYIQAFKGYNSPLPAPSTAAVLRVLYELGF